MKNLLKEVGIEANEADVKRVVTALSGKKLEDVIAEGMKKVGSLSLGGTNKKQKQIKYN